MRLGCIIAILIAVTLHTSSTAFPETLLAILASNAPQDAVASVDADVERHLRRAKPGAGDNTGKRMLAVHGNPGSFLTFVVEQYYGTHRPQDDSTRPTLIKEEDDVAVKPGSIETKTGNFVEGFSAAVRYVEQKVFQAFDALRAKLADLPKLPR